MHKIKISVYGTLIFVLPLDIYHTMVYYIPIRGIKHTKGGNNIMEENFEKNVNEDMEMCEHCRTKEKSRDEKACKDLINRLNRIEGQIRGIKGMVEKGAYCTDILTQAAAANAALNSFSRVLLSDHIKTCVADDLREGREDKVDELIATLQKMLK